MRKWSDALLDTPEDKSVSSSRERVKWSDVVVNDAGPQDQFIGDVPLSSVMSKELFKDQKKPAGFGTHFLAGFADDPQTKLRIYAATRFPDLPEKERLKKYGINKGEIVYMGDDGNLYRETPNTWLQKLKRFSAETGAHTPAIVMSIIGSLGGPGLATLGAAGGEGIRKSVSATVLKEPQTTTGNILSMAGEGAIAYGGDIAGRGIARGINRLGSMKGGKLAAQAGPLRGEIDPFEVAKMERYGKEFGIDLYSPQTTGSKRLADKFGLLGDLESSAPIIQAARKKQVEQIDNAVYSFLDTISTSNEPTSRTGQRLVDAAKKAIKEPVNIRRIKASPIYKKAYKTVIDEDQVSKLMEDPIISKAVNRVRKDPVFKRELSKIDENNIQVFDLAKRYIDDLIGQAQRSGKNNRVRLLRSAKDDLIKILDSASPEYKRARSIFGELSEEVTKQGKKTILGDVAKLEGDKVIDATAKFLNSPTVKRAPEIARKIRNAITKHDPEVWDNAISSHLQNLFESTKQSVTGGTTNIGGHFYKKAWGDLAQRKVLKQVMSPDSYNTLKRFMKVLERSGMILGGESATATRQVMLEELQGKTLGRVMRAATRPLYTKERLLGDRLLESILSKNARNLAEAMISEKAASQLKRMYQLSPTSQKLLPAVTNFLGMVSAGEFSRKKDLKKSKQSLPATMRSLDERY